MKLIHHVVQGGGEGAWLHAPQPRQTIAIGKSAAKKYY